MKKPSKQYTAYVLVKRSPSDHQLIMVSVPESAVKTGIVVADDLPNIVQGKLKAAIFNQGFDHE